MLVNLGNSIERNIVKLTHAELRKLVKEGYFELEVETEHRKGSTFYAFGSYEITEEDIPVISKAIGIEDSELTTLIGTCICANGTWSDWDSCDWYEFSQAKKVIVHVPATTKVELQEF